MGKKKSNQTQLCELSCSLPVLQLLSPDTKLKNSWACIFTSWCQIMVLDSAYLRYPCKQTGSVDVSVFAQQDFWLVDYFAFLYDFINLELCPQRCLKLVVRTARISSCEDCNRKILRRNHLLQFTVQNSFQRKILLLFKNLLFWNIRCPSLISCNIIN